MTKDMVVSRINELEAKLRRVMQYDLWQLWSWEEDQELRNLKAELEVFTI